MKLFRSLFNIYFICGFFISLIYLFFVSNDAIHYIKLINRIGEYNLSLTHFFNFYLENRYEPFTIFLFWFLSLFFSTSVNYIFLIFISLFIKFLIFRKYLYYYKSAFLFYCIVFSFIFEANQIRESFAIIFIFIFLLTEFKKTSVWRYTLVSVLFHYIGLILLFFYTYLIPKRINIYEYQSLIFSIISTVALCILIVFLIHYFSYIPEIKFLTFNKYVNYLSIASLIQYVIVISILLNWNNYNIVQKKSGLLLIFGAIIFLTFSDLSTIAMRNKELSLIGIIPILFHRKSIKNIYFYIILIASLALFLLFVYLNTAEILLGETFNKNYQLLYENF